MKRFVYDLLFYILIIIIIITIAKGLRVSQSSDNQISFWIKDTAAVLAIA